VRNSRLVPPDAGADLAAATITALFREHHGELVRLALLMVGDLPSAEDVVQDVYASLHTQWGKVADPSGRYLLFSYRGKSGFPYTGWIDHGKLRFLPLEHPNPGLPVSAW
jgi:hypothetical protein